MKGANLAKLQDLAEIVDSVPDTGARFQTTRALGFRSSGGMINPAFRARPSYREGRAVHSSNGNNVLTIKVHDGRARHQVKTQISSP